MICRYVGDGESLDRLGQNMPRLARLGVDLAHDEKISGLCCDPTHLHMQTATSEASRATAHFEYLMLEVQYGHSQINS